jgi:predicted SAM-dependent methyltransferase
MSKPVNLGCGSRFRSGWLNLDLGSTSHDVVAWDLRSGLPIESGTAPFVYSSHVLEHFAPSDAERVLVDVRRALRPRGVVRVVVPDLAKLARWYLEAFEAARDRPGQLQWATIHLFDQMVRAKNGGEMLAFLRAASADELGHAVARMGSEAKDSASPSQAAPGGASRWLAALRRPRLVTRAFSRVRLRVARGAVEMLLGDRGREAFEQGWFGTSGERHLWMYDSHSLGRLLHRCGFVEVQQQSPTTSLWGAWAAHNLDLDEDGSVYKPDSLYMEAVRP